MPDLDALPIFLPSDTVAQLLGFQSVQTFLDERPRLEDGEGFPPPVKFHQRPLRWRKEHVAHWLQRQAEDWIDAQGTLVVGQNPNIKLTVFEGGGR